MIQLAAIVSSIMVLSGCVTYQPKQYNIERVFTVQLDRNEASTRIKRWLTANGFVVSQDSSLQITGLSNNLDQLQGYAYNGWSGVSYATPVADCGRTPTGVGVNGGQISISLELDQTANGNMTQVSVVFTPGINRNLVLTCVSNGTIERTLKELLSK